MNWQQLKRNSCPKCGYPLQSNLFEAVYHCLTEGCGFKIGEEKFDEVMTNMTKGKFHEPDIDENLSGLSDL